MEQNSQKDKPKSLATFAFVFNEDFTKVLLIKRNKEKRKRWGFDWGAIGGKIEPGEYSIDAIKREVNEEIGIKLPSKQIRFMHFEEKPSKEGNVVHLFYSIYIKENENIKINQESKTFDWFPIEKLPEKMADSHKKIYEISKSAKEKH